MRELLVQADVEVDPDNDGLGDETQDAEYRLESPAPPIRRRPTRRQITKGPQDKTKKKQAIFEFTSTETGSTFECSVDGAGSRPASRR